MAVYLTGDLRFRLKNLMMERNVSQGQLTKYTARYETEQRVPMYKAFLAFSLIFIFLFLSSILNAV